MSTDALQILAISGSLRRGASNTVLLEAAVLLAAANMHIDVYDPELATQLGSAIRAFEREIRSAT